MTPSTATGWLRVASITTIAVGLLAAAASTEAADGPWLLLLDVVDWPADGEPSRFVAETRAVNAVAGGVMVGWGTLMYLLAVLPRPEAVATPMLLAVVAWFAVDSAGSLVAGLPGNVVLNLGFLALFLPPLVTLRRSREVASSGLTDVAAIATSSRLTEAPLER